MQGRRTHKKMIELKTILCKLLLISCHRRELPEAALAASQIIVVRISIIRKPPTPSTAAPFPSTVRLRNGDEVF